MTDQFPFNAEGYKSNQFISPEYKVNVVARMLSGYDELTWNKLKESRKRTYIRAATTLLLDWDRFVKQIEDWNLKNE